MPSLFVFAIFNFNYLNTSQSSQWALSYSRCNAAFTVIFFTSMLAGIHVGSPCL